MENEQSCIILYRGVNKKQSFSSFLLVATIYNKRLDVMKTKTNSKTTNNIYNGDVTIVQEASSVKPTTNLIGRYKKEAIFVVYMVTDFFTEYFEYKGLIVEFFKALI